MSAHPGVWAASTPAKHRNVLPQDAAGGNLILLDNRKTDIPEGGLLGEWERTYQLGVVLKGHKTVPLEDRQLDIWIYQPHVFDKDGKVGMPLWAAVAHARAQNMPVPKTDWESVISLPWRRIKELPLSVVIALQRGEDFAPHGRSICEKYCGTSETAYTVSGQGYRDSFPAANVAYVLKFDKGEAKDHQCLLNDATRTDILGYMHARRAMP